MRIIEMITEKTSDAVDINVISSFVANYIKNAWFPQAKEAVNSGKKLTQGEFQHIEKAILNGKGLPTHKTDFSDYAFHIGGIDGMVPKDRLKSEDIRRMLPRIYIELVPDVTGGRIHIPDEENEDFTITLNPNDVISDSGEFKQSTATTYIAHEVRHALDHALSKGKAPFYHTKGGVSDTSEFDDENSDYYTNQTEANARFSQVENRLINKLRKEEDNKNYTKEEYIKDVKKHFKDFHIQKGELKFTNSEKQYRRFVSRALELYREFKE